MPENFLDPLAWQSDDFNMFTSTSMQTYPQEFYTPSSSAYPTYSWQDLHMPPTSPQGQAQNYSYIAQLGNLSLSPYIDAQQTDSRQGSPGSDFGLSSSYSSSPGLSTPLMPESASHLGSRSNLQEEIEGTEVS